MKNTEKTTKRFARLPLIAFAALPLTVGAVLAQSSTNSASTSPASTNATAATSATTAQAAPARPGAAQPGQGQARVNSADAYLRNLAAQLGVTPERLKAAAVAAGNTTIDQAVKAGNLPAARAAEMKQRLAQNPFSLLGGHGRGMRGGPGGDKHGRGMGGPGQMSGQPMGGQGMNGQGGPGMGMRGGMMGGGQAVRAAVAKALGLTEQQLGEQLRGGQTVAQIAQAKGVSTATIHTAAVAALNTQLAADVKAGRLTQAQADEWLKRAQADANFGLGFGGPRMGQPGTAPTQNK